MYPKGTEFAETPDMASRQYRVLCRQRFGASMTSMNPSRINTSGIPEDVLLLINIIVFAVIILCATLVGVMHYIDRAKERRSKK